MKKKTLIISSIIIGIVVIIGIILLVVNKKDDQETYSQVTLGDYHFNLNDKYQYQYLDAEETGTFNNEMFLTSYLFIADEEYASLISKSSYYTDMGADELDSSIEEMKFGGMYGFVNSKKVYYEDIEQEYNLVIILIKMEKDKTLVVQYEVSVEEDTEMILKDIKNSLVEIEKN